MFLKLMSSNLKENGLCGMAVSAHLCCVSHLDCEYLPKTKSIDIKLAFDLLSYCRVGGLGPWGRRSVNVMLDAWSVMVQELQELHSLRL